MATEMKEGFRYTGLATHRKWWKRLKCLLHIHEWIWLASTRTEKPWLKTKKDHATCACCGIPHYVYRGLMTGFMLPRANRTICATRDGLTATYRVAHVKKRTGLLLVCNGASCTSQSPHVIQIYDFDDWDYQED